MVRTRDWLVTFLRVFFLPFPQTFLSESTKARGNSTRAYGWVVLASTFPVIFMTIALPIGFRIASLLIQGLVFPLIFTFYAFCVHGISKRLFSCRGNYEEIFYIIAGIFVPYSLIISFSYFVPEFAAVWSWVISAYALVLVLMAVKTLCGLKYWQAFLVVFLSTLLAAASSFCIPLLFFSLIDIVPRMLVY